jgi:hypothetical protein
MLSKKQADHDSNNVDAPSYLHDSVKEFQEESWDQMDDKSKFMEAKHYLSLDHIIKKEPAITKIERPQHIDPLGDDSKYGKKSRDYKMTQALARRMSLMRAVEIMEERGVKPTGRSLGSAGTYIDNKIWNRWKDSSTSKDGKILQWLLQRNCMVDSTMTN